jgi:glycerol transport system substrate-binding protein
MDEAKAFLDAEIGDMSTLDRADQEAEMQWFIDAAKPFAGMEIKVVSETITTHEYESKVLAPAFTAITGIKITHDLIGEGDVSRSCRPRCSRARTSMTPMSTTRT